MINKISAQTVQNFYEIIEVKAKLCALRNTIDNQNHHQNITLKIMTGVLVVIAVLLAVIAWT